MCIDFVTYECQNKVFICFALHLFNPVLDTVNTQFVCNIVANKRCLSISVVKTDHSAKPFRATGVPDVKFDSLPKWQINPLTKKCCTNCNVVVLIELIGDKATSY